MGAWYLSLVLSLFLILIGMTMHWSVMLAGILLLFVPLISMLLARRRKRISVDQASVQARPEEKTVHEAKK